MSMSWVKSDQVEDLEISQGFYLSACSTQSFQWMTLREEVSEEEGDIRGVFQAAIFRGI